MSSVRSRPVDRPLRSLDVVRFVLDAKYRSDPYPLYARLRSSDPVHHSPLSATLVSRYDDIVAVLRDPTMSSDEANIDLRFRAGRRGRGVAVEFPARSLFGLYQRRAGRAGPDGFAAMARRFLILMDPPDHTRLRQLASRAFSPRVAEAARPVIAKLADELLDRLEMAGSAELLSSYAYRLPVLVICRLLGVPAEDDVRFRQWVADMVVGLDIGGVFSKAALGRADAAAAAIDRYFRDLISQRRRQPQDDLLSTLIAAADGDDRLSEEELVAFATLLLAAGHETTANLIGNGLWHLFEHPDQLERFREADQPARCQAVEELLRYDSPVQMVQRATTAEVTVGTTTIPAGRAVMALLGAGNHDPERFADPDSLDMGRPDCHPLSFGFGAHHCLGAPLARAEAEIALGHLLDRFPRLRPQISEPRWRPTMVFRGLQALPCAF